MENRREPCGTESKRTRFFCVILSGVRGVKNPVHSSNGILRFAQDDTTL